MRSSISDNGTAQCGSKKYNVNKQHDKRYKCHQWEFGTDEYVDRWDESQKGDDSWAYTHDQPVKSEGGHDYKRMYNPDTEESYWYQMR